MPLFDYKCDTCGHEEDTCLVKDKDEQVLCPSCRKLMTRKFPHSNFYLKGQGWAPDGYSKPSTETK